MPSLLHPLGVDADRRADLVAGGGEFGAAQETRPSCLADPVGGQARLAVRRGHMNVAAKADDVTEAEAFEEFEQFDVAEAAIGQDRHRHALGQDRLQTRQAEVFEAVALVLQFVFVDRQPQERRRPAVTRDEAQSQRGLIVAVEIGPIHRHDDRLALAHDLARPWREQVPYDDPGVAQQAIDLFDRVSVRQTARLRQRVPDDRNGQRRSRQNPQRPIGQRKNSLGVQAPRKRALQKIMNQFHPIDRLAHARFCRTIRHTVTRGTQKFRHFRVPSK